MTSGGNGNWSFSGALRGGCVWCSLVEKEYDFKYCLGDHFVYGDNSSDIVCET